MPAVSQNNQLKIIHMPKKHIWGCHILLPFILNPSLPKSMAHTVPSCPADNKETDASDQGQEAYVRELLMGCSQYSAPLYLMSAQLMCQLIWSDLFYFCIKGMKLKGAPLTELRKAFRMSNWASGFSLNFNKKPLPVLKKETTDEMESLN